MTKKYRLYKLLARIGLAPTKNEITAEAWPPQIPESVLLEKRVTDKLLEKVWSRIVFYNGEDVVVYGIIHQEAGCTAHSGKAEVVRHPSPEEGNYKNIDDCLAAVDDISQRGSIERKIKRSNFEKGFYKSLEYSAALANYIQERLMERKRPVIVSHLPLFIRGEKISGLSKRDVKNKLVLLVDYMFNKKIFQRIVDNIEGVAHGNVYCIGTYDKTIEKVLTREDIDDLAYK